MNNLLFGKFNILLFILGAVCVIIGSILPDADIEDGKSKIFFWFFPIAIIARISEYPLSWILRKPAKHRGVLHHPVGIIFSSAIAATFMIAVLYFMSMLTIHAIIYIYIIIFLSQIMHLLEDAFADYFAAAMIVAAVILIAYFQFLK
jgi:hypothetical protein